MFWNRNCGQRVFIKPLVNNRLPTKFKFAGPKQAHSNTTYNTPLKI